PDDYIILHRRCALFQKLLDNPFRCAKKQSPRVGCRCVRLNTSLKSSLVRGAINAMTRLANVLYWAGCFLAVLFAACAVAALHNDSNFDETIAAVGFAILSPLCWVWGR